MEIDDLYGLAPDEFVPERGALAKALRAQGRRDEAAAVAKLRKPSAAAWAVNRLVRAQGDGVDELFAAGDAVREAQADVLAGRGAARALRAAGARERAAVDDLVTAARGMLSDASPATLDRVADTLHAAALDESARDAVRAGRLERELRHAGLGLGEGADVFAVAPAPAKAKPPKTEAKPSKAEKAKPKAKAPVAPKRDAAAERRAAKEQAAAEAAARKQARVALAKAAKSEERAGHALRAAQERHERAAHALAEADAALEEAQARAEATAEEHRRLRAQLDGA